MEYRIREATLGDMEILLHHRRCMFTDMGGAYEEQVEPILAAAREYLETALPDASYKGWLAESDDGKVVGGGGLVIAVWPGYINEKRARRAWILNMYTEPEFRKQGIARQILNTIVEWCRAEGFGNVSLHASNDGRALYESAGFIASNEMRLKLD
jgi:GNAT superfamily N-acetyltransferase